jgi:hypothetical protein
MADPLKSSPEGSASDEHEPISPPETPHDYSTEKQLDDRAHEVSPLQNASQPSEVVPEGHQSTMEESVVSSASTAYPNEKNRDDTQFSTEKQNLGPENEETSPKYATLGAEQPGLEHVNNAAEDAPEALVGRKTFEPEETTQIVSRGQQPPVDETEWHASFWNCFNPASLCMSFRHSQLHADLAKAYARSSLRVNYMPLHTRWPCKRTHIKPRNRSLPQHKHIRRSTLSPESFTNANITSSASHAALCLSP